MSARTSPHHVVLIPSYNTGSRLFGTIAAVRQCGLPVVVVIDGSTDGTGEALVRVADNDPVLFACILPRNLGKGAAVLHGLRLARTKGFTHALTIDADGQHSAAHIGTLIELSLAHPDCVVLGQPLFDASARNVNMWQLDSAATSAASGSTRCGLPKYAGAAEPGTSMPLSNRQIWSRL